MRQNRSSANPNHNVLNIVAMDPSRALRLQPRTHPINRGEKNKSILLLAASFWLKGSLWERSSLQITSPGSRENNERTCWFYLLPFSLSSSYEQAWRFSPLPLRSSFLEIRGVETRQEITFRVPTSKPTTKSHSIETKVHLGSSPGRAAASSQPWLLSRTTQLPRGETGCSLQQSPGYSSKEKSIFQPFVFFLPCFLFLLLFFFFLSASHYPKIRSRQDFRACFSTVILA